ncbi:MAG TPA: DUF6252 family protein, partial [Flavobacterium sp.]|uniref:DUF6252 family protein n=1 Tax=Flavobacterium sp. TaxID=239 RepID=UPI002CFCE817
HTSDFSTISGSFLISYIDYPPTISGLGTFAKINNQDWYGTQSSSSGDLSTTTLNIKNGSQYEIGIVYPYFSPEEGTFNFSDNNADNRIAFSKYDPATHQTIEYDVTGTITYATVTANYVQGTFSLTATHPTNGTTITISNGTFKERAAN